MFTKRKFRRSYATSTAFYANKPSLYKNFLLFGVKALAKSMNEAPGKFTNEEYIAGLRQNAAAVLADIFEAFRQPVLRFLIRHGADGPTAEDVFSDTLFAVRHSILKGNFQNDGVPFFFYFQQTSLFIWLKKANAVKKTTDISGLPAAGEPGADDLIVGGEIEIAGALLQRLTFQHFDQMGKSCQEILKSNIMEGKSLIVVAETLGLDYGYVRKAKSQCLEKLRRKLCEDKRFGYLKSWLGLNTVNKQDY